LYGAEFVLSSSENFQKAGAFKLRGASKRPVFGLSDGMPAKGVCTHSSGNHRVRCSYAAVVRRHPVQRGHLPRTRTGRQRSARVRPDYGGQSSRMRAFDHQGREAVVCRSQSGHRRQFRPPYNDPRVIDKGQGTLFAEFMRTKNRRPRH